MTKINKKTAKAKINKKFSKNIKTNKVTKVKNITKKTKLKTLNRKKVLKTVSEAKVKKVLKTKKEIVKPSDEQRLKVISKGKSRGFITETELLYLFPEIEEYVYDYVNFFRCSCRKWY